MHLGFIGLGHLGRAIAGRLIGQGHKLTVWNRTASRADGLDAKLLESPGQVAESADVIFICLFDSNAVRSVLTADNGIIKGGLSGKIVVDLTTNHFHDVLEFHKTCTNAGGEYLESPVLGSVVPAANGSLTVLISGNRAAYSKAKPILEDIGSHIFYLEKPSLATKMKLINNLVLGSFMATIAEAVTMGEASGISKSDVLEILSAGAGDSLVLNAKKKKLFKEDFSTHFSNALILKDLHCLQDLAYELRRPAFTGAMVKELYAELVSNGMADEDFAGIYKLFKK